MIIERIYAFNPDDIAPFLVSSFSEGFRFMKRFVDEFDSYQHMLDKPSEGLFVAKVDNKVVGIIGLNLDPYLNKEYIGRVRHLYVLPDYRNIGIASALLQAVISLAQRYFTELTLYTDNPSAERLYMRFGFSQLKECEKATHILIFNENTQNAK